MDIIEFLGQHGIKVNDPSLIETAMTHTSYANEHHTHHNERLEFMGDAVLQLWSSKYIFPLEPELTEGEMTRFRSKLVREEALAEYSKRLGLNQFLRLGIGEEKTGGREKDAICADMFEALLGALYIDSGWDTVEKWLGEIMKPDIKHPSTVDTFKDYKSKLQEYVQTDRTRSVHYELISETGPANAPIFTVNAVVDGLIMGTGSASSKKQAEQNAAENAFEKMVR